MLMEDSRSCNPLKVELIRPGGGRVTGRVVDELGQELETNTGTSWRSVPEPFRNRSRLAPEWFRNHSGMGRERRMKNV